MTRSETKSERICCATLFFAASLYIVFWAMSPDNAWMLPEAFIWKSRIVQDLMGGSWSAVFKRMFDLNAFEFAPRTTRPLASLFEVLDTVFRSFLWKIFTPHAALSLSWIFTLFLGPWLLFRILILRGISPYISLALCGIYLVQMGTLSGVVMLFRSGKPLMLFFLIVCWYLCELLNREDFRWRRYLLLLGSLLVSCLFDEFTLLTYLLSALLLAKIFRKQPGLIVSFLIPGVLYLILIMYLFPWCSSLLYGNAYALKNYGSDLSNMNFLSLQCGYVLLLNMWTLIREFFCLYNPFEISGAYQKCAVLIHLIMTIVLLAVLLGRAVRKNHQRESLHQKHEEPSWSLIALCSISAVLFHGLTMFMVFNKVWPPYYYGTFIGVLVILNLAEIWKRHCENRFFRIAAGVWSFTLISASMATFPALNNVYRQFHYYPWDPVALRDVFLGRSNRFEFASGKYLPPDGIRTLSAVDWRKQDVPIEVPKHLLWVVIERAGLNYPNREFDNSHRVATYAISNRGTSPASYVK